LFTVNGPSARYRTWWRNENNLMIPSNAL